jgi:GDP-L-fucose synthase
MAVMSEFWAGRTVVVTGGNGFLGRVVVRLLTEKGARAIAPTHAEYDLTIPGAAEAMLAAHSPSHVIHLAARVGGIGYNLVDPARLYLDNLMMGTHIIEAARSAGVDKTVLLGTVCSYPKFTPVPFKEESFWDGYPEETNAPYGIAKKGAPRSCTSEQCTIRPAFCLSDSDQPVRPWRQVSRICFACHPRTH